MGKRKSASIPCHSHKRAGQPSRTPPTSDTVRHSPPGKALPHVRADCPCSRQLCASSTGLSLEAVEFNIASADDCVYCVVCLKKEGEDFLLCDACDGGMHRQCALLDQVPAGSWACLNCQQHPTLDSAIRQASHSMHVGLVKYM